MKPMTEARIGDYCMRYPTRPCAYCGETIDWIGPQTYEFNHQFAECNHCNGLNKMGYEGSKFIWRKRDWVEGKSKGIDPKTENWTTVTVDPEAPWLTEEEAATIEVEGIKDMLRVAHGVAKEEATRRLNEYDEGETGGLEQRD